MKSFREIAERFKRAPTDVVAVDFGSSRTKAVRMTKTAAGITLQAADVLEAVSSQTDGNGEITSSFTLPGPLKARYVSLALSAGDAVIKLLSFPGQFDAQTVDKVVASMGIKDTSKFRIGYKVTVEGHSRAESRVLAVALPEESAQKVLAPFASGLPAPHSIEVSGLSTLSAFLHGPGTRHQNEAIAVIEFGAAISSFAVFNKGVIALLRRFNTGTQNLLDKLADLLGVDQPTAEGIVTHGSFDISATVSEVVSPLVRQMVVSRDFVERRDNCHVSAVYTTGGLAYSHDVAQLIRSSLDVDARTWSPLENLKVTEGALSDELAGQEWCLGSAIGAGIATLEGS